jgi:hypothetical protein
MPFCPSANELRFVYFKDLLPYHYRRIIFATNRPNSLHVCIMLLNAEQFVKVLMMVYYS